MPQGKLSVLIAEDSRMFRSMLADILTKEGYSVTEACDGAEALDLLSSSQTMYSLMMLDINMPNIDGIELLEKIKSGSKVALPPTLVLTATNPDSEMLLKLRQLGANGYIVKTLSAQEILYRIRNLTSSGENRRRDMRELLAIPLEYSVGSSFLSVKSFDFSKNGSFIATTNPVPVGKTIKIRLVVPTVKKTFEIDGKVIYHIKLDGMKRGSYPPGMGVKFSGVSPEDQKAIEDYVNFVQSKKKS